MHDTQQDPVDVGQMIAWIADGETPDLSLIHISEPTDYAASRMPSSA